MPSTHFFFSMHHPPLPWAFLWLGEHLVLIIPSITIHQCMKIHVWIKLSHVKLNTHVNLRPCLLSLFFLHLGLALPIHHWQNHWLRCLLCCRDFILSSKVTTSLFSMNLSSLFVLVVEVCTFFFPRVNHRCCKPLLFRSPDASPCSLFFISINGTDMTDNHIQNFHWPLQHSLGVRAPRLADGLWCALAPCTGRGGAPLPWAQHISAWILHGTVRLPTCFWFQTKVSNKATAWLKMWKLSTPEACVKGEHLI